MYCLAFRMFSMFSQNTMHLALTWIEQLIHVNKPSNEWWEFKVPLGLNEVLTRYIITIKTTRYDGNNQTKPVIL